MALTRAICSSVCGPEKSQGERNCFDDLSMLVEGHACLQGSCCLAFRCCLLLFDNASALHDWQSVPSSLALTTMHRDRPWGDLAGPGRMTKQSAIKFILDIKWSPQNEAQTY